MLWEALFQFTIKYNSKSVLLFVLKGIYLIRKKNVKTKLKGEGIWVYSWGLFQWDKWRKSSKSSLDEKKGWKPFIEHLFATEHCYLDYLI